MVTAEQIDDLMESLESELASLGKREIPSTLLGEMTLSRLRTLDEVAYVRFASVYRQFRSVEDFIAELNILKDTKSILAGTTSLNEEDCATISSV
jgi:transcriptional repressor NrdR